MKGEGDKKKIIQTIGRNFLARQNSRTSKKKWKDNKHISLDYNYFFLKILNIFQRKEKKRKIRFCFQKGDDEEKRRFSNVLIFFLANASQIRGRPIKTPAPSTRTQKPKKVFRQEK